MIKKEMSEKAKELTVSILKISDGHHKTEIADVCLNISRHMMLTFIKDNEEDSIVVDHVRSATELFFNQLIHDIDNIGDYDEPN